MFVNLGNLFIHSAVINIGENILIISQLDSLEHLLKMGWLKNIHLVKPLFSFQRAHQTLFAARIREPLSNFLNMEEMKMMGAVCLIRLM